jgi:hypothetical protein
LMFFSFLLFFPSQDELAELQRSSRSICEGAQ